LIGPDPDHPLPNPVVWEFTNITMTNVSYLISKFLSNYSFQDGKQCVGERKKPDNGWEGFMIEVSM